MLTDAAAMPMLAVTLKWTLWAIKTVRGDGLAQAFGHDGGLGQIGFRQQDRKFLAAQSADDVGWRLPFRQASATAMMASSPTAWPYRSLTCLK